MRAGGDARLRKERKRGDDGEEGITAGHKMVPVYSEMLLQICSEYPGLPDPRTLSMAEIRFFYEGARASLHEHTKPRPQKAGPKR